VLERWDRYAPLTGIWAIAFWLVAVLVIEGVGDPPGDATPENLLAYFESDEPSIYIGGILFFIGSALLIWWSGALRASIGAAGDVGERLGVIAFGAGVAIAVLSMATFAPQISAAFTANESDAGLSPDAAQAMWAIGDGFFIAAEIAAALLVATVGIAILRTRLLPVWWAWVSFLLGVLLLIPFIGWAGLIFGFPIWIVVTSVLLFRRPTLGRPLERPVTPA
jgi:hypothetical protein